MSEPAALQNRAWGGEVRAAVGFAVLLPAVLLTADAVAGDSGWRRAVVWIWLGLLLLLVLWPTRVSAAPGLLTTRGLVRSRRVRTDRLASAAWHDGVAQRLVLTDTDGGSVELDPRVFADNPPLWYRVGEDIGTSVSSGTLDEGLVPLRQLCSLIDRETARAVFRASALT
ncbi:hypothetical protein [Streptomyces sp. NPDC007369]|uniref:hypothetical protein n=1 Tax=Streptomyces sp. NPDC007369 TaxID=3154589 RepID=UPI0033CA342C